MEDVQSGSRAIILAAGRGSRMGDATEARPKGLTLLGGRPLLEWQLDSLAAGGVDRVAIVTGYLAGELSGYGDVRFENTAWAETNMVASLFCAESWLERGPCLVSYSDIVFRPEIARRLLEVEADIAIAYDRSWQTLWQARFDDPLSDAETFRLDERGDLCAIGERAARLSEIEGQYMGLLRFEPAGWRSAVRSFERLGSPPRLDMTSLLRALLEDGVRVQTVPVDGGWCEVDDQEDLELYQRWLESGNSFVHDWRTLESGDRAAERGS